MKLPTGYVVGQGVTKASGFGGKGQRMLESMGWQKGQGLGKGKDGMKEAIEVKKKEDTLGVRRRRSGLQRAAEESQQAARRARGCAGPRIACALQVHPRC
jgi:hypothetical protein